MATFIDWFAYVFDRTPATPEWFFDIDEPTLICSPSETVTFLSQLFVDCRQLFSRLTDDQVGLGLNYLFSNSCSDVSFALKSHEVPSEKRMSAIRAIKFLYRDCFNLRCAVALGHRNDPAASQRLNYICYMLWDVSPIAWWDDQAKSARDEAYSAVIYVLQDALQSTNLACIESALHGLGHIHLSVPERVEPIIKEFLQKTPRLDERLKEYAARAEVGHVL